MKTEITYVNYGHGIQKKRISKCCITILFSIYSNKTSVCYYCTVQYYCIVCYCIVTVFHFIDRISELKTPYDCNGNHIKDHRKMTPCKIPVQNVV